ncbi:MAG: tetratricopeptide repeat protein [Ktedonobacteraceae bacterium]|nr:tetratricopeptide repeat protein [Ktedonobacteraceae bacterium]
MYATSQPTENSFFFSSASEEDCCRATGPQEAALAAYEQAIQLAPHEGILHYYKGVVLESMGRYTEARQAFAEARLHGYQGKQLAERTDLNLRSDAGLPYANAGNQ